MGRGDLLVCTLLVGGRDGVLESEHHDVGTQPRRLLEHTQVAAVDGELGTMKARRRRGHDGGALEPDMGQSPSHARPAISHDRDGRHGPRTAGDLLEVGFVYP
jgi:hypothetical protein